MEGKKNRACLRKKARNYHLLSFYVMSVCRVIVEWSATQRNLWQAICLLGFVWSNPDRHRRKGLDFRAFVCPHISGQASCAYSIGLLYRGHFSRVLDVISHEWCHENQHEVEWFRLGMLRRESYEHYQWILKTVKNYTLRKRFKYFLEIPAGKQNCQTHQHYSCLWVVYWYKKSIS